VNFLEQLAAEWYNYQNYFVRTNVRTEKLPHGGHSGEMDVLAYEPHTRELIHIETSSDAWPLKKREEVMRQKMRWSHEQYERALGVDVGKVRKIAVCGPSISSDGLRWGDIEVISISEFIRSIHAVVSKTPYMRSAVPEKYPLLRTMQITAWALRQATEE